MLRPRPVSAQVVLSGTVGAHPVDLTCCHPAASGTPMLRPSADHVGSRSSGAVAGQSLRPSICDLERYRPPVRRLSTAPQLVDGEDHGRIGAPPTHGQLAR
jgi:hypothetical protein